MAVGVEVTGSVIWVGGGDDNSGQEIDSPWKYDPRLSLCVMEM